MRKRIGIICLIAGAALVLSALLLFLYNRYIDDKAGKVAETILDDVREKIDLGDRKNDDSEDSSAPLPDSTDEMPVVSVDGNEYIGYLSIPALSLELPVMAEWDGDYGKLNVAPCRHYGSVYTDDIVIAGHNYTSHFAYLSQLREGHTISFTDMNGDTVTYAIEKFEVIDPADTDRVRHSGYDLVLYTCTYSGSTRFTVFANRVEKN